MPLPRRCSTFPGGVFFSSNPTPNSNCSLGPAAQAGVLAHTRTRKFIRMPFIASYGLF